MKKSGYDTIRGEDLGQILHPLPYQHQFNAQKIKKNKGGQDLKALNYFFILVKFTYILLFGCLV